MAGVTAVVKKVLKQPIAQFFLFGGAVFVAYGLSAQAPTREARVARDVIVVDVGLVPQLQARFQNSMQKPAMPEDMQLMLAQWVREEIEVRAARDLGLDQNDDIVRQRLLQKMRFLTEAAAQSAVPDPAELQSYFEAHAAKYAHPSTVSFDHVFLGGTVSPEILEIVLEQVQAGGDPAEIGSRSMLPVGLVSATSAQVENVFGVGFFEPISALTVGEWHGPVPSTFGLHLVKVAQVSAARSAVYLEVQDAVLADWQRAQSVKIAEDMHQELAQNYSVEMPTRAAVEKAMTP